MPANSREFTVYIVDDEPAVLKALTRLVGAAGYAVKPFASAQAFIAAHDPHLPGCAIVDVLMPDIDGLELQRTLRSTGRQVVLLSGTEDAGRTLEAAAAGAIDVLTKPVDSKRLFRAIEIAAAHDRVVRAARQHATRGNIGTTKTNGGFGVLPGGCPKGQSPGRDSRR